MGTVDNFKHCCRFIGSFRGTLRATPTIAVFTRLFLKARYKVDTVEPCYYGRWGAGGGVVGGIENVLIKNSCRLFSRGMIFTRTRVSLVLLSLRENGGPLAV